MHENEQPVRDARRRAVLGAGAAGATVLALGRSGQAKPTEANGKATPAKAEGAKMDLVERDITYRSGDTDLRAFWVEPSPSPVAALVVIHEIWGLNDHIRDVARRFARQGYTVLAPDLYTREGAPNLDVNNRPALMAFLASISDARMVGDLQAAVAHLKGEGALRVGSIGFCMGGLYSYLLACKSDALDAAVDFYGRIVYAEKTVNKPESPIELAGQLKCPLLGHFGETDGSIPVSDVEKLREALKDSTQPWKLNVYPGAGHAFFNNTRPSYHAEAAADAGTETLRFLKTHVQEPAIKEAETPPATENAG